MNTREMDLDKVIDAYRRIMRLRGFVKDPYDFERAAHRRWPHYDLRMELVMLVQQSLQFAREVAGPMEMLRFVADWPHGDWLPI